MGARVVIEDQFAAKQLAGHWTPWTTGTGQIACGDRRLELRLPGATAAQYSDAQITAPGRASGAPLWRPPLRMTVRAWASHSQDQLRGTAGFGFWNEPFVPGSMRLPRVPRAVWFFCGSPPNNMALAQGVPGWGWKAATFDAARPLFWLLLPAAPLGFLLMRVPALYRRLWPLGQRAIGVSEALLPVPLTEPHTYTLEWRQRSVHFSVDDRLVHVARTAPRGPLRFIAWIDNQYAVVTPQGCFRFGLIPVEQEQWLALDYIRIETLDGDSA